MSRDAWLVSCNVDLGMDVSWKRKVEGDLLRS